ncbi:MAG: single-stranded-DNA-specific exonuclease RecJ [Candidatus Dependentiae bacterium]|nr:single-stranded-DNA-specific exonuclease RecJ [Candidatus Dependentiae bacterium]
MIPNIRGARYVWRLPSAEQRAYARSLGPILNLSLPVVETLVNRGFTRSEEIESFLFMSQDDLLGHPSLLHDAERVIERIKTAIDSNEKILIAGDYDVDGMTATAMMLAALEPLGADVNFFLPHRIRDGYGISERVVHRAAASGYRLIITVDNGITGFKAGAAARACGIDLIITDHHRPLDNLPEAFAIVDPMHPACAYPFKELAGVGVAFKIIELLYEQYGYTLPGVTHELLLLGTVADVVPLRKENRFFVRRGLRWIAEHESPALRVLKDNAKLTRPVSAMDIGFSLAPQLNALGRLEDPRQAVKFLLGDDKEEIAMIGAKLFELNQARKLVEKAVVEDVRRDIADGKIDRDRDIAFIAARSSWPPGVIGLAASRIVSEYGRPVFLFHETQEGVLKGSCRSIPGLNIFNALSSVKELLEHFGGHAAAAGLAVRRELLGEFKLRVDEYLRTHLTSEDLTQKISCDAELALTDANAKLMRDLSHLEPCGSANERPTFYVRRVQLVEEPRLLKEEHVRCMVFADGVIKPVIFFGRPDLFEFFSAHRDGDFDLAVTVAENEWEGVRRIEFYGVDAALASWGEL